MQDDDLPGNWTQRLALSLTEGALNAFTMLVPPPWSFAVITTVAFEQSTYVLLEYRCTYRHSPYKVIPVRRVDSQAA